MSWKTCPSLRSIIFTGKCLKILKFRPQLLGKNDNYFFVLLNFDHLKKKLFFGVRNIRVITVVSVYGMKKLFFSNAIFSLCFCRLVT